MDTPETDKAQFVAVDFDPFAGSELSGTAPSTEGQREIWAAAQMGEDASAAFNESVSLRFVGDLDVAAFEGAVQDLVARHEALRTTFSPDGLTLCIAASQEIAVAQEDLRGAEERDRAFRVRTVLAEEVQRPFSLEYGPLFRVRLLRLGEREHLATFTAHHIVCDGWSMAVMLNDLGALYTARRQGKAAELPEAPRFSAYARAEREFERSEEYAAAERYWVERLSGSLPSLDLPLDAARPPSKTYSSRREDYALGPELVTRLKKAGAKQGASFFTVLLSAFSTLLARLSGESELVVGIPAAGQSVTGQAGLVGHCVNTLPLRLQVEDTSSVAEFLRSVRSTMLDAYEHQRVTFGGMLKKLSIPRDPSRMPVVSVLFNVDQAIRGDELPFEGLEVSFSSNPRSFENFEIFINAAETRGAVVLECQYNADLFAEETIRRWLSAYEELLEGFARDAEAPLGELSCLPEGERARLLYEWNATFADFPRDLPLHRLLEEQAKRTPERVAVVCGEHSLSYRELDERANRLSHRLRRMGVQRDVLVGLCTERSLDMVVGLLGILKAGGAYVPLDPMFPRDRLAFMVEDSRLGVLVAESQLQEELGLTAPAVLCLDKEQEALNGESSAPLDADPERDATPESLAYVIYTSGSTGKPKGVCVPHVAVVNFLTSMAKEPGLGAEDVLLAVTTLSFDIAVLELFLPLSVGARVVLATKETASDGTLLREAIAAHGVTVLQATPSTYRLLLAAGYQGDGTLKMLCGGEALPRELAGELARHASSLWNMYGPTETTVWSTCYRIPPGGGRILVGKPIANTTLYVLDAHMKPVPVGVPGELHIGGDGVTRGYLHRPELTAERFVPDTFSGDPSARIYKTGDIVRFLPDGNLEYLRRNDNQIKLRGYRIELGEVEAAIARTPSVRQAVAVIREVRPGDSRLIGYVVPEPGTSLTDAEIRAHMRESVPDYMVPQHFVQLEEFPLTPNGKVDRKALPPPSLAGGARETELVAPRTETEAHIAAAFQDLLGVESVSVHDNFFDLGGHSVLAAQVLARLQREHGIVLPFRKLFEAPTVAGLAALLPESQPTAAPRDAVTIPRLEEGAPAPLSLMQQRLWFLEQLDPGLAVQNLPSAFRIRGALNAEALERAIQEILARHEVVRTVFGEHDGEPVQIVRSDASIQLLPPIDLSDVPAARREAHLIELLEERAARPFDLARGPLFTGALYRLGPEEHVLFWMVHHAVWDGWSFDVFLHELDVLYGAFSQGKPSPLPPLPIRYRDFAAWHRRWLQGPELDEQASYWREQLKAPLPILDMPTDRPRPARITYAGATEPFLLTKAEMDALAALGRRADATVYMVLLAAFQLLLSRYSGQEDIIVGTPIRGRSLPETQDLLGFFVNTLVFRTDLSGDPSFLELLGRVRRVALDAYAHQDMPFEQLVQDLDIPRDTSRTPIYQAFFTYQNVSDRAASIGELAYSQIHVHAPVAMTDLYLWVKETGDGLTGGIDYATDLFDRETIVRFLKQFRQLLSAVCEDATRTVRHVNILPEAERRAILAVNDTRREFPRELGLHQLFEQRAAEAPERVAVVYGDEELTYGELDRRATELASRLRAAGVARDVLVGLYLDRSPAMLVALLGVLKAGGGYVPLDPAFPRERLEFMVADSRLRCIVTERALKGELPAHEARVLVIDEPEADAASEAAEPAELTPSSGDATAYVIYTSGSTGKPKGVIVHHEAVVNFVNSMANSPGVSASDTILAITTLSFDIAVTELWLPLSVGAKIVLASKDDVIDGERLLQLIRTGGVTLVQATPATWRLLVGSGLRDGEFAKALVGGEAFPLDLAQELVERVPAVWNVYGPTETTVWSTSYLVPRSVERMWIGRPLDNTSVYVVDTAGELCPLGVPGELLIGGAGVTQGYLHRPELTEERFLPDPFGGEGRVYRTGDIVRQLASGNLEYLRRNDFQVKVRGYRIEIGEIETTLKRHDAVEEAVVLAREDRPGDVRIVAYVTRKDDVTDSELRAFLRTTLPDYMVPQHFVDIETFPLTPNGKFDRKALPPPDGVVEADEEFAEPEPGTEQVLAEIWREALGVSAVSAHHNFFTLGGHSLLALKVTAEIEKRLGAKVSPRSLLLNSLRQIAAELPETAGAAAPTTPAPAASAPATSTSTTRVPTTEAPLPLSQRLESPISAVAASGVRALESKVPMVGRLFRKVQKTLRGS
ncbi:MAG: amino acid adenylation domain-containing protein [Myxococcales bacterium]|jgi:amino acid adenylation domain-containing protein|nr:amino acid adenylation domain-containing protein [Myxococcales bacterium]